MNTNTPEEIKENLRELLGGFGEWLYQEHKRRVIIGGIQCYGLAEEYLNDNPEQVSPLLASQPSPSIQVSGDSAEALFNSIVDKIYQRYSLNYLNDTMSVKRCAEFIMEEYATSRKPSTKQKGGEK